MNSQQKLSLLIVWIKNLKTTPVYLKNMLQRVRSWDGKDTSKHECLYIDVFEKFILNIIFEQT